MSSRALICLVAFDDYRFAMETTLIVMHKIKHLLKAVRCQLLSLCRLALGGGLLLVISACGPLDPADTVRTLETSSATIPPASPSANPPANPPANPEPVVAPTTEAYAPVSNTGPELAADVALLRPYLRGNRAYGWQPGQVGKPEEFWNQRVNQKPVNSDSSDVTDYLSYVTREIKSDPTTELFGRFDLGKKVNNENYSIHVLEADADTPRYDFTPRADEFWRPHCDRIAMPVPVNGRLQGQPGYQCEGSGDCHLYVVDSGAGRVYEQYRAHNPGPNKRRYLGGCTNVWDLTAIQPKNLRGLSCTSANAAGIPYVPLLVTPGEIKRGVIRHALAFTMPNGFVERDRYARPATHNPVVSVRWGKAFPGPGRPMRYGSHFRLKPDFNISSDWPPSLRVVLQALKDYGMYHIDGGPRLIVLTNDAFSPHHWDDPDIALNPRDLNEVADVSWKDFELISEQDSFGSMRRSDCNRRSVTERAKDVSTGQAQAR